MWFCLFLIACFVCRCALARPVPGHWVASSGDDDDYDAGIIGFAGQPSAPGPLGNWHEDGMLAFVHYTGLNTFPGDTDDSRQDYEFSS